MPLGTAADEAEKRLRQLLGVPVTESLPGCNGETGRRLTWKSLTAFLSDGGDGGPVELSGWLVEAGENGRSIVLPYGTAVGDAAREVLGKVPSSTGEELEEGPYAGNFVVTTEEAVELLWLSPNRNGTVDEAVFRAVTCD